MRTINKIASLALLSSAAILTGCQSNSYDSKLDTDFRNSLESRKIMATDEYREKRKFLYSSFKNLDTPEKKKLLSKFILGMANLEVDVDPDIKIDDVEIGNNNINFIYGVDSKKELEDGVTFYEIANFMNGSALMNEIKMIDIDDMCLDSDMLIVLDIFESVNYIYRDISTKDELLKFVVQLEDCTG